MKDAHPEDFCHKCGQPNIVWFAPNELWNKSVRDANQPEILCPVCFVRLTEAAGFREQTWRVAPRDYDPLPSVVAPTEQVCKCGLEKDDPIHSFTTEWQQMHRFESSAATPVAAPQQTSSGAWHEWFDRLGEIASADGCQCNREPRNRGKRSRSVKACRRPCRELSYTLA